MQGEIVSTGTILLDSPPRLGELIKLGVLAGTVERVIPLASETRVIVDVNPE